LEQVRNLLEQSKNVPEELIFVARNMNLVRANNKSLGSPVNRVNIMGKYAAKGTFGGSWTQEFAFKWRLFLVSMFYYSTRIWKTWNEKVFGKKVKGFEEILVNI